MKRLYNSVVARKQNSENRESIEREISILNNDNRMLTFKYQDQMREANNQGSATRTYREADKTQALIRSNEDKLRILKEKLDRTQNSNTNTLDEIHGIWNSSWDSMDSRVRSKSKEEELLKKYSSSDISNAKKAYYSKLPEALHEEFDSVVRTGNSKRQENSVYEKSGKLYDILRKFTRLFGITVTIDSKEENTFRANLTDDEGLSKVDYKGIKKFFDEEDYDVDFGDKFEFGFVFKLKKD